jgi:hypothetical protein
MQNRAVILRHPLHAILVVFPPGLSVAARYSSRSALPATAPTRMAGRDPTWQGTSWRWTSSR